MQNLNQILIDTVRSALKGAKLAKFNQSIDVLNASLDQGAWIKRGKVTANSGFYQGLINTRFHRRHYGNSVEAKAEEAAWQLDHCLSYGHQFKGNLKKAFATLSQAKDRDGEGLKIKVSEEVVSAWVMLCREKDEAFALLDEARPPSKITAIGLSPKVTKTLTEMNLDIELSSIKMAKLEKRTRQAIDREKGGLLFDKVGKAVMEDYFVVIWSNGIVHGQSRFSSGCEACGKHIPSGRFVPIEAHDKNQGGRLISLWLGSDCSANIFGVKDIGIAK